MNMRQTFHPVALFALALCFATTSGLAQREVKPTVLKVPHQQMRVAFEKFQTVESLTGTTATSVLPTALSVDVNATAETIFVASSPSARLHLKADENVPLPLRVGVPQPDASGGMAVIEPFVRCSAFVRRDAVYQAELIIGIAATNPEAHSPSVSVEAKFAVLVTGGTATPSDFSLTKAGTQQRVVLTTQAPRDVVAISIVALIRQKSVPFDLSVPVQKPTISVNVSPESILGYGLGTATVLVQGDGNTREGEKILLKTTAGSLVPMAVVLDASRTGTATLRSVGTGNATVSLATADYGPQGTASVRFVLPWAFPLWSLAGGLLGTSVRLYGKKAKKQTQSAKHSLRRLLFTGVGLSFIGAVLWSLGMQVLPGGWSPTLSEAAALAVSAVVGYLGAIHFPWSPAKG